WAGSRAASPAPATACCCASIGRISERTCEVRAAMKIIIPDDYQDMVDRLECFALIRGHDVVRYRAPARDLAELAERLSDADVVLPHPHPLAFSRALLQPLP